VSNHDKERTAVPPTTRSRFHQRITGAQREEWKHDYVKRYGAGSSIRKIAEDTGRSYGFVHRLLVEAGITLRQHGGARVRRHQTATPSVTRHRGDDDLINSGPR
jgi:Helix-turn-helix domain